MLEVEIVVDRDKVMADSEVLVSVEGLLSLAYHIECVEH